MNLVRSVLTAESGNVTARHLPQGDRLPLRGRTLDRIDEAVALHGVREVRVEGVTCLDGVGVAHVGLGDVSRLAGRRTFGYQGEALRHFDLGRGLSAAGSVELVRAEVSGVSIDD